MEELIKIASYPRVGVQVQTENDQLKKITLSISSSFTLQCPHGELRDRMIPWLKAYCQGQWTPFPTPALKTSFAQKAASFLQSILPGEVISYLELAQAIGHPRAARAVGTFCSSNLFPLIIPCHRVIPASGTLGLFTPTPQIKNELLQFEGFKFSQ